MKQVIGLWFLLLGFYMHAQAPKKFYLRFGGNGYDYAYDVKQTLDKGYIMTGSTSSFGQGNTDMYLIKLDSMGQKKFETSFGSYNNDIGKSVIQLQDSGYVIAGYTNSTGFGGYDLYLVKADKNGNLVWEKTIGGTDWDFANSIQQTSDGGFIIGGTTYSYGYGNADGYILKTDANGNILWSKTYGGEKDDEFKSVIQTLDGGFSLTGYTKSYNDTVYGDGWIFKLDALGDSIDSKSVGGNYKDVFNQVIQLPNTNLYFVGANESHTNGANSVCWQYVIDISGALVLNNYIGNIHNEWYNSNAVGINGMVASVGYNNYMGNGSDASIHIFQPNLSYYAYLQFNLENIDELFSISKTADKGFVGVGTCVGSTSVLNDCLFIKTDSLGNFGTSITSINDPLEVFSLTIYPNPASDFFEIYLGNSSISSNLHYKIMDMNGRVVDHQKIIGRKTMVDLNEFTTGIYVLQLFKNQVLLQSSKLSISKP